MRVETGLKGGGSLFNSTVNIAQENEAAISQSASFSPATATGAGSQATTNAAAIVQANSASVANF
jgi:hypothetical protein